MALAQAMTFMSESKNSMLNLNHNVGNWNVIKSDKFTLVCKDCNNTITVDMSAELPVSGDLNNSCVKPEKKSSKKK